MNTELLSHDTIRLGKVQSLLYRLIKSYTEVWEKKQSLRGILPIAEYRNMSFTNFKETYSIVAIIKWQYVG